MSRWRHDFLLGIDFDEDAKSRVAREVIEENFDILGRLHQDFRGRNEREMLGVLLSSPNFGALVVELRKKARTFNRGTSSKGVEGCLSFPHTKRQQEAWIHGYYKGEKNGELSAGGKQSAANHPEATRSPVSSSETARQATFKRIFEDTRALSSASLFRRTKGTIPEYRSFSNFNSMLKTNEGAMLHR